MISTLKILQINISKQFRINKINNLTQDFADEPRTLEDIFKIKATIISMNDRFNSVTWQLRNPISSKVLPLEL